MIQSCLNPQTNVLIPVASEWTTKIVALQYSLQSSEGINSMSFTSIRSDVFYRSFQTKTEDGAENVTPMAHEKCAKPGAAQLRLSFEKLSSLDLDDNENCSP